MDKPANGVPMQAARRPSTPRPRLCVGNKIIDRIQAIAAYNEQLAAASASHGSGSSASASTGNGQLPVAVASPMGAASSGFFPSSTPAAVSATGATNGSRGSSRQPSVDGLRISAPAVSSPGSEVVCAEHPGDADADGASAEAQSDEEPLPESLVRCLSASPSDSSSPNSSSPTAGGTVGAGAGGSRRRFFYSFEFFPPKTAAGVMNLYNRVEFMGAMEPLFVDITWGTGGARGTTSGLLSLEIAKSIQQLLAGTAEVMMHLTCTNLTEAQLLDILEQTKQAGIRNILALRGDPPRGAEQWEPVEEGLLHAVDLVRLIRKHYGDYFCVGVAGYPEGHVAAKDIDTDVRYLAEKVAAGADFVMTQQFLCTDTYFAWLDRCEAAGIRVPIIPGIMAIQNYNAFKRMTAFCKTHVPKKISAQLEEHKHDDAKVKLLGIQLASDMCRRLLDSGRVPGLHFFTLNLQRSVCAILERLGFIGQPEQGSLPWKQSHVARRQTAEEVRPIFWSNRPQSYLSRTHTWDEYPNGRWGDSRSPAFGDLYDYHGLSLRTGRISERAQMWGRSLPRGVQSVCDVFAGYLLGKIPRLPWCEAPPHAETQRLQPRLVRMNRNGFLTINSQPRVNGAPSSDPQVGWGGPDGYVYQKAYLEFFCSPENLARLLELLPKYPSLALNALDHRGRRVTNLLPASHTCTAVTWGVFPDKEIIQPTVVDSDAFLVWKDEAFLLWRAQWQAIYASPAAAASWSVIETIHNTWFLVSLVDNNFVSGDIFAVFEELLPEDDAVAEAAETPSAAAQGTPAVAANAVETGSAAADESLAAAPQQEEHKQFREQPHQ